MAREGAARDRDAPPVPPGLACGWAASIDTFARLHSARHNGGVSAAPVEVQLPSSDERVDPDRPWVVIVWNDPINLMSYVVLVFQKLFGYSREKATKLMLDVHHKGRAVVSSGTREKAELDVFRLHEHGLWATMQQD
jgi:ATP-dependent Clp protease adaptor protein ClpS